MAWKTSWTVGILLGLCLGAATRDNYLFQFSDKRRLLSQDFQKLIDPATAKITATEDTIAQITAMTATIERSYQIAKARLN